MAKNSGPRTLDRARADRAGLGGRRDGEEARWANPIQGLQTLAGVAGLGGQRRGEHRGEVIARGG